MVEIDGQLVRACATTASEGMELGACSPPQLHRDCKQAELLLSSSIQRRWGAA